jgi:hypothetical protein
MLAMRNGCCVQIASDSDVRRICPPPSPSDPSILDHRDALNRPLARTPRPAAQRPADSNMPMWLTGKVTWAVWPGSLVSLTPMVPSQSSSKRAKNRPRPTDPRTGDAARARDRSAIRARWLARPVHPATMRPIIERKTGQAPHPLGGLALDGGRPQEHDPARREILGGLEIAMQHDATQAVADEMHSVRVDATDELREFREYRLHRTTNGAIREAVALETVARGDPPAKQHGLRAREPQAVYENHRRNGDIPHLLVTITFGHATLTPLPIVTGK